MNKKLLALILVAVLAISALVLAGCTAKTDDDDAVVTTTTTAAPVENDVITTTTAAPVEDNDDDAPALGANAKLADFVAEQNATFEQSNAATAAMGYKIEVKAEGDKLVYIYTYDNLSAEMVETTLDTMGAGYNGVVGGYSALYGIKAIEMRFVDGAGKVLGSREF